MTTPLDIIREKKRIGGREALTALEMIVWNEYWRGKENDSGEQIALAETAANELAHMTERIKEHLPK